jgi:hypothetical protein
LAFGFDNYLPPEIGSISLEFKQNTKIKVIKLGPCSEDSNFMKKIREKGDGASESYENV